MTDLPVTAVVRAVLYCVQFDRRLDDAVVERLADMLIWRPLFDLTREQQHAAIVAALASDATLSEFPPTDHQEPEFRDFLGRLRDRLATELAGD